ncbi:MAG: hypothetical protein Q7K65_00270 [Candidatus Buchananbacteria bacterium]|nr:hypothetical protein [Candidatus Buchananbacteria bacterium]
MSRRNKIILISALALVAAVLIFLFFFNKKPAEVNPPENENGNQPTSLGQIDLLPPPSAERQSTEKDYPLGLESLTSSFAERFASYSSDAKFKNLEDLKILSTSKMQSSIDSFIATSRIGTNGFEAQEAKALNNQLIYLSADKAMVLISLQLSKFQGEQAEPIIDYSKVQLSVLKTGDDWKVDEAVWQ